MNKDRIVALIYGKDHPGIVSKISSWIYSKKGNIDHADQHKDPEANIFFQRIEWTPLSNENEEALQFKNYVKEELMMEANVSLSSFRPKVALFVSKVDHCFHDIILRFKASEINGELACIISNHKTLENEAKKYNIPFYYTPLNKTNKREVEVSQHAILKKYDINLVILARYMQILSSEFLSEMAIPVINIHHSFLPAFAGSKPYHQAYSRGVKIIGATAHYATAELDEGPIIFQDVTHISHRNNVLDLIQKGKDLEKSVFAQAVRLHLNNKILVYNNKTVIFD